MKHNEKPLPEIVVAKYFNTMINYWQLCHQKVDCGLTTQGEL